MLFYMVCMAGPSVVVALVSVGVFVVYERRADEAARRAHEQRPRPRRLQAHDLPLPRMIEMLRPREVARG